MNHEAIPQEPRLTQALRMAADEFYVCPIKPRGKDPLWVEHLCEHGFNSATRDEATIRAIWTAHPDAGVGWNHELSGTFGVDADSDEGEIEAESHGLDDTIVRHSRKRTWIFRRPEECVSYRAIHQGRSKNIDLLTGGGSVAFNTHPEGHEVFLSEYRKVSDLPLPPRALVNIHALAAWRKGEDVEAVQLPAASALPNPDIDRLPLSETVKRRIFDGAKRGGRSDAQWFVLRSMVTANLDPDVMAGVIWHNPIGEKARKKGLTWLAQDIARAQSALSEPGEVPTMADVDGSATDLPRALEMIAQLQADNRAKDARMERWRDRALKAEGELKELREIEAYQAMIRERPTKQFRQKEKLAIPALLKEYEVRRSKDPDSEEWQRLTLGETERIDKSTGEIMPAYGMVGITGLSSKAIRSVADKLAELDIIDLEEYRDNGSPRVRMRPKYNGLVDGLRRAATVEIDERPPLGGHRGRCEKHEIDLVNRKLKQCPVDGEVLWDSHPSVPFPASTVQTAECLPGGQSRDCESSYIGRNADGLSVGGNGTRQSDECADDPLTCDRCPDDILGEAVLVGEYHFCSEKCAHLYEQAHPLQIIIPEPEPAHLHGMNV